MGLFSWMFGSKKTLYCVTWIEKSDYYHKTCMEREGMLRPHSFFRRLTKSGLAQCVQVSAFPRGVVCSICKRAS